MSGEERCKASRRSTSAFESRLSIGNRLRCKRAAWKDGYCKQHHPDTVRERQRASDERYRAKRDAETERLAIKGRRRRAAWKMVRALREIADGSYGQGPTTARECLNEIGADELFPKAETETEG